MLKHILLHLIPFASFLRVFKTLAMQESIASLFEEEQMSPNEYYEMVKKC